MTLGHYMVIKVKFVQERSYNSVMNKHCYYGNHWLAIVMDHVHSVASI